MGEHAQHRAAVELTSVDLCGQIAVRPFHHHLVRVGEPRRRGEHTAGVAHRHPVAQEGALLGDGGGEVDGAEDQHPRRRGVACHEHRHPLAAALAVGAVGERLAATRGEQAAHIVGDCGVGVLAAQCPLDAQRPLHRRGAHDQPPADPSGVGMVDHGGDRDGPPCGDVGSHHVELGKGLPGDRFDEDVENAAAGETDREGVVVADAVALQPGDAGGRHLDGRLIDGRLDAAPRHRSADRAVRIDDHRGTGWAGGGPEGANHRGQARRGSGAPDADQLGEHVLHAVNRRPIS